MEYYCSTKFTDLEVSVQSRLLYNCCKAYPERVDLDWLEANPGRLFHTDTMLQDRGLMLDNKSCVSCHHGCYKYEEQGLPSQRQQHKNTTKISDPQAPLSTLQISLSTDCNLTCMYCSPQWSSSWHRDIDNNGEYLLDGVPVKQNDKWSTLWAKMKQKSRGMESRFFQLLLREIKLSTGLQKVTLLGGEPLLNNQLDQVLEHVHGKKINIVTGLGVSHARLRQILQIIKGMDVSFSISAEATGPLFELIRHGVTWSDFRERVSMIEENGNSIQFISTISNLSVLGFNDFYDLYSKDHDIILNTLSDTAWMMPHVLDHRSKNDFIDSTQNKHNLPEFNTIFDMIDKTPEDKDRINTGDYLKQFSSRRSIDLDFLPAHFLKWCGL
jgi:organic radical activating enzyme|tara:strand:- start:193 stop:1341 length:1149 start_codon:yes stop_codon:yes gene_type:complete